MPGTGFPSREFGKFWLSETVSSFGTYVTLLALQTLVVLTMGGSAQDVGWLNSVRWLPYLLLGLIVGALVDRRPRRPVMVCSNLAQALLLISIPVAWATGSLSMPLLLAIVFGYGTASLINGAASMSFLPRMVARGDLQPAHARIDGADAAAQTTGPVLAGLLVKLVGAPLAVLINAATHLFSAAILSSLRVREPERIVSELPNLRREISTGVRWVYGASGLKVLAISTHVWFAANAILGAVLAAYALVDLRLSPFQFGIITACAGVGGVCGALLSGIGGRRLGPGGAIIAAHTVSTLGACLAVVAGIGTTGWAAAMVLGAGQACHGFGIGFSNSHEMSYRQALTPDQLQARTNITMRSFNRTVIVVVAPLGGMLAVQLGARQAILIAALIFLAATLILAVSPFRHARIEPQT